ncbi:TraU family protein [Photobacterium lutimaris]|uniref:TIGR03756 family integrating conjugative element protein n=1 Tax=Photobacterium lutimaris TaxID=388278 RepID=A0A2T3ITX7_9GAMM|nr:TraU family protein [Photobacterium lutimaris]PSU31791.1 hypothetical protein C9I99_21645 [Photobacterium lutimaris]TDR72556.1 hypothetical protein DFP78_11332 [Photobacterium lutimaris]
MHSKLAVSAGWCLGLVTTTCLAFGDMEFPDIDWGSGLDGLDIPSWSEIEDQVNNSSDFILAPAVDMLNGATAPGLGSELSGMINAENNPSSGAFRDGQKSEYNFFDDSVDSVDASVRSNCYRYRFHGQCVSMKTSLWPRIYTNTIAQNYVPDFVVEVTSRLPHSNESSFGASNNPTWIGSFMQEANAIVSTTVIDPMFNVLAGAPRTDGAKLQTTHSHTVHSSNSQYLYRDALVYSDPMYSVATSIVGMMAGYCRSPEPTYVPYFSSGMDTLSWRFLTTTETVLLGLYSAEYRSWNHVGSSFGSLMPRNGYHLSSNQFETAVTTAYRAASIVNDQRGRYSGTLGLHVHNPARQYASGSWTRSEFRTLKDHRTMRLREIYPQVSGNTCRNYTGVSQSQKDSWNRAFNQNNSERSAGFKLYRPMICCRKQGNKHLENVWPNWSSTFETY